MLLTAEGYLNYRQEPRVQLSDLGGNRLHMSLREAREFLAEFQAAIFAAEQLRLAQDIAEDAHESRKAEGM